MKIQFKPEADITAYELAMIMGSVVQYALLYVPIDCTELTWSQISPEVRRHWTPVDDNMGLAAGYFDPDQRVEKRRQEIMEELATQAQHEGMGYQLEAQYNEVKNKGG
jgi:hypothetical protein